MAIYFHIYISKTNYLCYEKRGWILVTIIFVVYKKIIVTKIIFSFFLDLNVISSEAEVDITHVVPLQRQSSFCKMFSTIVTRLQNTATALLPELLSVLLKVIWSNSWCLEHKKEEVWFFFCQVHFYCFLYCCYSLHYSFY